MKLRWNKQLIVAYRNTFESPEGKLVLEDLKKKCPTLTSPVGTSNGIDVNLLLVHTGQENVLKHIYKMLSRDPNEEQVERARTEERSK